MMGRMRQVPPSVWLFAGLLAAGTAALGWLAAPVGFLSDDWRLVQLAAAPDLPLFSANWHGVAGQGGFYRPLVMLSLRLDHLLGGGAAGWFHLTNVLLHLACALLVTLLYRELARISDQPPTAALVARARWPALAAGLLFFVLPIHTDNIFWVAGRTDTLCGVFSLTAVLLFAGQLRAPHPARLAGCALALAAALLSKEMALGLPLVLGALALWRGGLRRPATLWALAVIGGVLLGYLALRWQVLGSLLDAPTNTNISLFRVERALRSSLRLFFTLGPRHSGAVVLVLTLLLAAPSLTRWQRARPLLLLTLALLLGLLPVLGLIVRWYLYIPSAFACLLLARVWLDRAPSGTATSAGPASLLQRLDRHRGLRLAIAGLFVALLCWSAVTLAREGLWWRQAAKISEQVLTGLTPHAGREVLLLNVPSAFLPPGAVGEKPLLANYLRQAMGQRAGKIQIANHMLLRTPGPGLVKVRRVDRHSLVLRCDPAAAQFTFHTAQFVSNRVQPFNVTLRRPWGTMRVVNPSMLVLTLARSFRGKVLSYDGARWREVGR